ncbi:MAG TPA: NAD(P)-dependent oxidoreductase [Tepidisphaeraceae bacterium]|jgi:nucleoside-diphosphate-sugar epimerase|nr:NAD(P)-dependent oxidoreductase [Tepidisphaeraceae bacterium]
MKVLFTGASSFTGFWFVQELSRGGHEVTAIFRRRAEDYTDELRRRRVQALREVCRPVFGVDFGGEKFIELVKQPGWDVLCNHAADVTNYKSPDFNVAAAVENNTRNLPAVLKALKDSGCSRIVLTGSVFENDEGAGSEQLAAFSPYGLSKGLTAQMFRYYVARAGLSLGKFVIPNPFGPFEEPRFTGYLVKNWFAGVTPAVSTPLYVRDNIHVSLLAKVYVNFVQSLPAGAGFRKINPSGYVESQASFALRFAREMQPRLRLACQLEMKNQTDFSEPRVRINTDVADATALGWDERTAWDAIADYYRQLHSK